MMNTKERAWTAAKSDFHAIQDAVAKEWNTFKTDFANYDKVYETVVHTVAYQAVTGSIGSHVLADYESLPVDVFGMGPIEEYNRGLFDIVSEALDYHLESIGVEF